ncbi:hypothetical protein [Chryseobacterium sp. A301]
MKRILLFLTAFLFLAGCKKEAPVADTPIVDTLQIPSTTSDSLAFTDQLKADSLATALNEQSAQGKLQFKKDQNVILSYDLQAQNGEAVVEGKSYGLTKMQFSENNYILSGPQIKVIAENGSFNEMTSDCLYGMVPNVEFILKDKTQKISTVGVQHCPVY